MGELRHGSNGEGIKYGKPVKKRGILGVCLNMDQGTLAFAIDGEYFGVAFKDESLTKGPVWAAVSMLHQGGCTLVSGIKTPDYFLN